MTQSELPLYPKLSSIYNKIMQLAIAIVLIIILMNILLFSQGQNQTNIEQHFRTIGEQYTQQSSNSLSLLLSNKKTKQTQQYIDQLVTLIDVKEAHVYDVSGQLLFHSTESNSINELYGISEFRVDNSALFIPFVSEVRTLDNQLQGYVRLTLLKSNITEPLLVMNDDNFELFRILLVLAGIIGFLLTRGLNRFSRQGYRLHQKKQQVSNG